MGRETKPVTEAEKVKGDKEREEKQYNTYCWYFLNF